MNAQDLREHLNHLRDLHALMMLDWNWDDKLANTGRRAELEDEIADTEHMLELLGADID